MATEMVNILCQKSGDGRLSIFMLDHDQQYSRIKQMNKHSIDFFYMHLFTMWSQCIFKWVIQSGRSEAGYSLSLP
jgi:hypothetical protein